MSTFLVGHKDSNDEGRWAYVDSPDVVQAAWKASQDAAGGTLAFVHEVDGNGHLVASVPAGNGVESV